MAVIDFRTLEDGEQFEDLCEDLFKAMGYNDPPPERSGRGPDRGRDLIVTEHRGSDILGAPRRFRWLVECKTFAKSNKSVQPQDIGSIVEKLLIHNADGYLLVTTTIPSTMVESYITAIDRDERLGFEATYWAKPRLTEELLKHRHICEKYFGPPPPEVAVLTHWSKHNPFLAGCRSEHLFCKNARKRLVRACIWLKTRLRASLGPQKWAEDGTPNSSPTDC
jgi:hypothetical protein